MPDSGSGAQDGRGGVMRRWVLASSNAGKLREFEHALGDVLRSHRIELINQSTLGVTGAKEPHDTFSDNALAKARHASLATGLPALADDSGICVTALGGAPGVRSARYWEDALAAGPRKSSKPSGPSQQSGSSVAVAQPDSLPNGFAVTAEELQSFEQEHREASTDERNLDWLLARMRKARQALDPESDPPDAFWNAAFIAVIAFVRKADDQNPVIVTGRWEGRIVLTPQGTNGFGYDPIFFDPRLGRTGAQLSVAEKERVSHRGQALRLFKDALPAVLETVSG